MFQIRGQDVNLVLNHQKGHTSTVNTLSKPTNASTGHLLLAYGTHFQGLVQFSRTDFESPVKSSIASAGNIQVKLMPGLRATIRDKSHMILTSLS